MLCSGRKVVTGLQVVPAHVDDGDGCHPVVVADVHQLDALRRAALLRDVHHRRAEHDPVLGDHHQFVFGVYGAGVNQGAALGMSLERDHALAAAVMARVFFHRRALAVPLRAGDEEVVAFTGDFKPDDGVAGLELDAAHATRKARGRPQRPDRETNRLAVCRDHDDVVVVAADVCADELVGGFEVHRDQPVSTHVGEVLHRRLLCLAQFGAHDHELVLHALGRTDDGGDALALVQHEQLHHGGAARLTLAFVHFPGLDLEAAAAVGEEDQAVVGVGDDEMADVVIVFGAGTDDADAATPLGPICVERDALDVATRGDRHDDLLVSDHVLLGELLRFLVHDQRAPLVAELVLYVFGVVADQEVDLARVGQKVFEVVDLLQQLRVLRLDLVALQARQTAQLQVQHSLSLAVRQLERLRHQLGLGVIGGSGAADRLDHFVQHVDRLEQTLQDVRPLLRLIEFEFGAAADNVAAVVDEGLKDLLEADGARLTVNEGEHVDGERRLHRRVLVESVQ